MNKPQFHNPENLTPGQWGETEGYRLLTIEELEHAPSDLEINTGTGGLEHWLPSPHYSGIIPAEGRLITYRTKKPLPAAPASQPVGPLVSSSKGLAGLYPNFDGCSVRVMRSHDYCHFEVVLSSSSVNSIEQVDLLRKGAARLADKAVEQFKIAKVAAQKRLSAQYEVSSVDKEAIAAIESKPETERTPEEQAEFKAYKDALYASSRSYDYEDDFEQDDDDDN